MEAFATAEELEARWRALSADELKRAEAKLADASVLVAAECARAGIDLSDPDELAKANLSVTVCEMAKRAMLSPADRPPVTQGSMTGGPYSETWTYANPTGDLYLTAAERRRLGIGSAKAGFAAISGGAS